MIKLLQQTQIPLSGLHNTRDLGGIPTKEGRSLRPFRCIRSGELYASTEADRKILAENYKLSTVIDFRTEAERIEKPDPVFSGVRYFHIPILEESALGITREKRSGGVIASFFAAMKERGISAEEYMSSIYEKIAADSYSRKQYKAFFDLLLDQQDGAVLWHCSAGKDRVGAGTALFLSALDVEREIIVADYLMTNAFLEKDIKQILQAISAEYIDDSNIQAARALFCVQEIYIRTVFATLEKEFGSIAQFLLSEMDLTPDKIAYLKAQYTI